MSVTTPDLESGPGYIAFDRAPGFYEATRAIPAAVRDRAARLIAADAGCDPGLPFLDAGVGTGRFSRPLRAAGLTVVGADVSVPMLTEARRLAPGLPLVRADLRRLPFSALRFGGALLVHVLHLIEDWQQVLAEVRRVLAPGCALYLGGDGGMRYPTYARYFEAASRRGALRERLGAKNTEAIFAHLQSVGAVLARIDEGALVWTASARRRDLIDVLRINPFSDLWHLPPALHDEIVTEVEQQLRQERLDLDAEEHLRGEFTIWRATSMATE